MFSYDVSSERGRVRLLIGDTNVESEIFSDREVDAFLAIEGSIRTAAALALETMASGDAYTLKVITLLDLRTDGAATAAALMKRAAALRAQQAAAELAEEGGAFDVAEWVVDDFSTREYWRKRVLT